MRFYDLIDTILSSDWNNWYCIGGFPNFKYGLRENNVYNEEGVSEHRINVKGHDLLFGFKENVELSIALGIVENDNFIEDYANQFDDSQASLHYADVFYKNALVFRARYLKVDRGRVLLPLPKHDENTERYVEKKYHDFIRLLHNIYFAEDSYHFDNYFNRLEAEIRDENWPHV